MGLERDVVAQFPQLARPVHGRRLVYLDSAATTLKPLPVVDAVSRHLREQVANVHRGAHFLSDEATQAFEDAREKTRAFVGAADTAEIVFTRGTTEGVNLLARSLGGMVLEEGDEILLSQMEHHSNIVPWQMIAREKGASVKFTPVNADGMIESAAFRERLSPRTRIVSLVHLSNALGTVNPLPELFAEARRVGALCIADAAQSAAAMPLRVGEIGCDFLVFSGHKMFGPTGIGVLYGKREWLEKMPPYQGGGSMITEVTETSVGFLPPPHRFEAGTPPIAEVIGLGAAIDFLNQIGFDFIQSHERGIFARAAAELEKIPGLRRIGRAPGQRNVLSFLLERSHPSDVGAILNEQGVAIRAGHHCCQPLMRRFGLAGTARASFSVYSTEADVEQLAQALRKAGELLS